MQQRLRVTSESGETTDYDGNQAIVCNDGSLMITKTTQTMGEEKLNIQSGRREQAVTMETRLLVVIRRDLWREVATIDVEGEAEAPILSVVGGDGRLPQEATRN